MPCLLRFPQERMGMNDCLDCGAQTRPFEILEIDQAGRNKIRFLCVCGIVMDVWV
jgi:hypothetical protein